MTAKWNNPHQWLLDYAKRNKDQTRLLMAIIRILAYATSAEMIKHLFGDAMEKDGYLL